MTTNAATWFYQTPENIPYLLVERVRTTFWDERLTGLWLDVLRAESPILLEGTYNGANVKMEWEPMKWFRLSSAPAAPALVRGTANILRRKPVLRYEDTNGQTICEWHLTPESVNQRWQEIQGKPVFRNPQRLDKER